MNNVVDERISELLENENIDEDLDVFMKIVPAFAMFLKCSCSDFKYNISYIKNKADSFEEYIKSFINRSYIYFDVIDKINPHDVLKIVFDDCVEFHVEQGFDHVYQKINTDCLKKDEIEIEVYLVTGEYRYGTYNIKEEKAYGEIEKNFKEIEDEG